MAYNKDLHCIELCLRYIKKMKDVFGEFHIKSLEDFENSETCQLAMTQLITNVHEPSKKINTDVIDKMPLFSKLRMRIKVSRNIASHDYESVDLEIVYRLVTNLIRHEVMTELENAANGLRKN